MKAGINSKGAACSVNDFDSRKRYTPATRAEQFRITALPIANPEKIADIDNGDKYQWLEIGSMAGAGSEVGGGTPEQQHYGFRKYGRTFLCMKTGVRRGSTIGEFYQGSPVD